MKNKQFIRGILVLLAALSIGLIITKAQTRLPDRYAYRGNIYAFPALDIALDDTANYTVKLYYSKLGAALPTQYQPVVVKSPGLLQVKLNATTALPALAFVEVKADGQTTRYGNLYTDKRGEPGNSETYVSFWQLLMSYNY